MGRGPRLADALPGRRAAPRPRLVRTGPDRAGTGRAGGCPRCLCPCGDAGCLRWRRPPEPGPHLPAPGRLPPVRELLAPMAGQTVEIVALRYRAAAELGLPEAVVEGEALWAREGARRGVEGADPGGEGADSGWICEGDVCKIAYASALIWSLLTRIVSLVFSAQESRRCVVVYPFGCLFLFASRHPRWGSEKMTSGNLGGDKECLKRL